ncbi:hypothetical protein B0H14DRAFT_398753 [Mycena olivaceomarginata]|nr:hypothetical protein B0H14DRAFT_398753 [Mycena olivaceomarginata]
MGSSFERVPLCICFMLDCFLRCTSLETLPPAAHPFHEDSSLSMTILGPCSTADCPGETTWQSHHKNRTLERRSLGRAMLLLWYLICRGFDRHATLGHVLTYNTEFSPTRKVYVLPFSYISVTLPFPHRVLPESLSHPSLIQTWCRLLIAPHLVSPASDSFRRAWPQSQPTAQDFER